MKLGPEHIGKKVRGTSWLPKDYFLIEWINGDRFAGIDEKGEPFAEKWNGPTWEFYQEPPKHQKPSERIRELFMQINFTSGFDDIDIKNTVESNFKAIFEYLDELHEKGKI